MARRIKGIPCGGWNDIFNVPMTAHIIGGAAIADSARTGVIDPYHRVYGHPGLHVVDGAAVSANLGVNPALTITAQASAPWPCGPMLAVTISGLLWVIPIGGSIPSHRGRPACPRPPPGHCGSDDTGRPAQRVRELLGEQATSGIGTGSGSDGALNATGGSADRTGTDDAEPV